MEKPILWKRRQINFVALGVAFVASINPEKSIAVGAKSFKCGRSRPNETQVRLLIIAALKHPKRRPEMS